MNNEKVYAMSFAKVYPLLTAKAEKKGRTIAEVNEIICWLTGYSTEEIEAARNSSVTYGDFFQNAPLPNPNRKAIKGVVCGVRVEYRRRMCFWKMKISYKKPADILSII